MSSMNSSARSASRQLAVAQIPDARYVELAGEDVLPYLADAGAIVDEIGEFLTGARGTAGSGRSLATVLFTGIAGSTDTGGRFRNGPGATCGR